MLYSFKRNYGVYIEHYYVQWNVVNGGITVAVTNAANALELTVNGKITVVITSAAPGEICIAWKSRFGLNCVCVVSGMDTGVVRHL